MNRQNGFFVASFMVVLIFGLLITLGYLAYRDQVKWAEFSASHDCKRVAQEKSGLAVGITSSGNGQFGPVVVATGGKTGFKCNDGVTYWR